MNELICPEIFDSFLFIKIFTRMILITTHVFIIISIFSKNEKISEFFLKTGFIFGIITMLLAITRIIVEYLN